MEFGLKGTSRLVTDVTGSRHSGLGFTVFWLFTAEQRSAYSIQRGSVIIKQCCAAGAELINNLLWVKQPCKRQKQFTTSVRHISRQTSKVCWAVAKTLEFPLDVNSQLLYDSRHNKQRNFVTSTKTAAATPMNCFMALKGADYAQAERAKLKFWGLNHLIL